MNMESLQKNLFVNLRNTLIGIMGYFLLSMFAKACFGWESSAITFWPASGLANALAITHGWSILPGLAIGNLLGTACDPNKGCAVQPFMIPIAISAAAQAGLVRTVVYRQNLLNDNLTRISRLLPFLLWIGPLGNWPAAFTFFLYKLLQDDSIVVIEKTIRSTLFWWIGDSLGSMLFLPFLLLLLPIKKAIWKERKRYLFNPLIALICLLTSGVILERLLLERIDITPEILSSLQDLRVLSTFSWMLVAMGTLGLILQLSGKAISQERRLVQSSLAADSAGAVIHEIGQPLILIQLRLERLVDHFKNISLNSSKARYTDQEIRKEAELGLKEVGNAILSTRSIKDLTLSGIRDTNGAVLEEAITQAYAQHRHELDRLDQDLTINIEKALPEISAGQIQLQSAIRNLITNASKAAGEHGVIRIHCNHQKDYIYLEIEDSGLGFDSRFHQGLTRYNSTTGGMGLGLLIVQRVIDDNGGKIEFSHSQSIGGAKVKVWFKKK